MQRSCEQLAGKRGVSHQYRWIAGPTSSVDRLNFRARYNTCRLDHLPDGSALPAREVYGDNIAAVEQILQCQHMRAGKIGHMDIIADRGASAE